MKRLIIFALIFFVAAGVFAQEEEEIGSVDAERLGIDAAQQRRKEISIDKFEREGFWLASMSTDDGHVVNRLFQVAENVPAGKQPIPEEEGMNIPDIYVLGTRVDFIHRGYTSITVYPQRPIPIEGITKSVSVWVAGRNYNHQLKLLVEDFFGRTFELEFESRLNFQGWKKMKVSIPAQAEDGFNGIVQRNYHYNNQMGIKIIGFRIDVDPWEAYGSYYIYFDDLRAETDLFAEEFRDPDDMPDGW